MQKGKPYMQYRKYDFKDVGYLLPTKQISEIKELKGSLLLTAIYKEIGGI